MFTRHCSNVYFIITIRFYGVLTRLEHYVYIHTILFVSAFSIVYLLSSSRQDLILIIQVENDNKIKHKLYLNNMECCLSTKVLLTISIMLNMKQHKIFDFTMV